MEIDLITTFTLSGSTYKEVRENLQAKIDEFLKGTKGTRVRVEINPLTAEVTLAGYNQITSWECSVWISQKPAGEKK